MVHSQPLSSVLVLLHFLLATAHDSDDTSDIYTVFVIICALTFVILVTVTSSDLLVPSTHLEESGLDQLMSHVGEVYITTLLILYKYHCK